MDLDEADEALEAELAAGSSRRDAVARVAAATGAPKRLVYDLSLRLGVEGAGPDAGSGVADERDDPAGAS